MANERVVVGWWIYAATSSLIARAENRRVRHFFTSNVKPICIEEKQLRERHTCGLFSLLDDKVNRESARGLSWPASNRETQMHNADLIMFLGVVCRFG